MKKSTFWKVIANNLLALVVYAIISTIGMVIVLGTSIGYEGNPALFLVGRYLICLALFLLAGRLLLRSMGKTSSLLSFLLVSAVIIANALVLIVTVLGSHTGFISGGIYSWWINFWYSATAALFFDIHIYDALHGGSSYPVFLWLTAIPVAVIGPSLFMYLGLRLKMWQQNKNWYSMKKEVKL